MLEAENGLKAGVSLSVLRKKSVAPATLKKLIGQKRPEFAGIALGGRSHLPWLDVEPFRHLRASLPASRRVQPCCGAAVISWRLLQTELWMIGYQQHDAQELLLYLLDALHEARVPGGT